MGCCGRVAPLDMIEFDDPAMSAGAAGMEMRLDIPIFGRFGQFSPYILAFEEESFRAPSHKWLRETDKLV